MPIGKSNAIYPGAGGKNDISLSLKDYYDMIVALREYHISKEASLKYKNLYNSNRNQFIIISASSILIPLTITHIVFFPVRRFHSAYKMGFPLFFFLYVFKFKENMGKQTNRRLYTELFTDEGVDGVYLRRTLRDKTPNLWAHVSRQMFRLGYEFEEMFEVGNELPSTMIDKRLLE